jgi:putative holliday junction resolvase
MEFLGLRMGNNIIWCATRDLGLFPGHVSIVIEGLILPANIIAAVPQVMNLSEDKPYARILGMDVGSKTIGLAVSDPLGITAQGLETIRRKNKRTDLERVASVIREFQVAEIVVGYPLRLSGTEGSQATKVRAFADELRRHFGLPVHLWDERLSSAEANRLLRETEMSIKRRGEVVDRLAAVLILQNWMEAKRH